MHKIDNNKTEDLICCLRADSRGANKSLKRCCSNAPRTSSSLRLYATRLAPSRYATERRNTMRKITTVVVAILLQIALCVGSGISAEKQKSNSQKQTVSPKETPATPAIAQSNPSPAYLTISFDPSIQKIPVPYLGHDIEQTYKAFDERKKAERKDEFETTEQFQRRLTEQAGKPLFGSVGQDSVLAFVVSAGLGYDADSQTLTISLPTSAVWQSAQIDKSRLAVKIKSGKVTKDKSIGQNAYGAKVEIEKTYAKGFELAIHNESNFASEKVLDENMRRMSERSDMPKMPASFFERMKKTAFVQRIKMSPEEARAAKDKISVLILAKPVAPYISYGAILREATFKDPTEFFSQMYYVDVDLGEIWIYNKQSGEIITKIKSK